MEHTADTQADKDQSQQSRDSTSSNLESTVGATTPVNQILQLQRQIGNHAVNRMLVQRDPIRRVPQPQIEILYPRVTLNRDGAGSREYDLSSRELDIAASDDMTGSCYVAFALRFGSRLVYYRVIWMIRLAGGVLTTDGDGHMYTTGTPSPDTRVTSRCSGNSLLITIAREGGGFGVVELLTVNFVGSTQ